MPRPEDGPRPPEIELTEEQMQYLKSPKPQEWVDGAPYYEWNAKPFESAAEFNERMEAKGSLERMRDGCNYVEIAGGLCYKCGKVHGEPPDGHAPGRGAEERGADPQQGQGGVRGMQGSVHGRERGPGLRRPANQPGEPGKGHRGEFHEEEEPMKYSAEDAVAAVVRRVHYACIDAEEGNIRSAAHSLGMDAEDMLKIADAIKAVKEAGALYEEIVERDTGAQSDSGGPVDKC